MDMYLSRAILHSVPRHTASFPSEVQNNRQLVGHEVARGLVTTSQEPCAVRTSQVRPSMQRTPSEQHVYSALSASFNVSYRTCEASYMAFHHGL